MVFIGIQYSVEGIWYSTERIQYSAERQFSMVGEGGSRNYICASGGMGVWP